MSRRTTRSRPFVKIARIDVISTVVVSLGLLVSACNQSAPTPAEPTPAPPLTTPAATIPEDTRSVAPTVKKADPKSATTTVLRVDSKGDGTTLVATEITSADKDASPEEKAVEALNQMASGKDSPLPQGTKALSVKIEGELATVDLSKEFKDNFSGGSTAEALAINAVTATLGQFPGVRKVQFLVQGQKIEALGGGQELTDPLPVTPGDAPKES